MTRIPLDLLKTPHKIYRHSVLDAIILAHHDASIATDNLLDMFGVLLVKHFRSLSHIVHPFFKL